MILSCLLTWARSVLWQHIMTRCACVQFTVYEGSAFIYSELHTRTCPKPDQFSSCPPSNFVKIYLILGAPSDLFPQVSPLTLYCNSAVSHTCYIYRPSQSSWFYHLNNIWWGVQTIKFLIMLSSPLLSCPSQHQISSSVPYSWTPSAYVSSSMWETKFLTHTNNRAQL